MGYCCSSGHLMLAFVLITGRILILIEVPIYKASLDNCYCSSVSRGSEVSSMLQPFSLTLLASLRGTIDTGPFHINYACIFYSPVFLSIAYSYYLGLLLRLLSLISTIAPMLGCS